MAAVTIDTTRVGPEPATAMYAGNISKLLAGEAIAKGEAVYIKSDGKVWLAVAAADDAANHAVGLAASGAAADEAITILSEPAIFDYSTGMSPGIPLYVSASVPGGLDTVATLSHPQAFAQVIDANRIRIVTHFALW